MAVYLRGQRNTVAKVLLKLKMPKMTKMKW